MVELFGELVGLGDFLFLLFILVEIKKLIIKIIFKIIIDRKIIKFCLGGGFFGFGGFDWLLGLIFIVLLFFNIREKSLFIFVNFVLLNIIVNILG